MYLPGATTLVLATTQECYRVLGKINQVKVGRKAIIKYCPKVQKSLDFEVGTQSQYIYFGSFFEICPSNKVDANKKT